MTYKIIQGDNRDILKTIDDNSIDAIVTDPPYGIDFLGKDWDANTGALETYQECLRVLKPGGHILAFSAARTYHHLAITLERAGFEIRDQIMWIYSSAFPKSQDIGKSIERHEKKDGSEWYGWGTSLKPAHEPIALARKPVKDSIIKNVQQWGVGGLNIKESRIERNDTTSFPSNVLGEITDYQKYFYCPKISGKERHMGFESIETLSHIEMLAIMGGHFVDDEGNPLDGKDNHGKMCWTPSTGKIFVHGLKHEYEKWCKANNVEVGNVGNNHPTVKPVALMEYLIKLITPQGGTVLDPFNGSGSTGMAAVGLGYNYIGIELDPAYVNIAETRIAAWLKEESTNNFKELFDGTE